MPTDLIFDLGGVLLDLNMQDLHGACHRLGIDPELFFVKTEGSGGGSTVCQGISASKVITDYQIGSMTTDAFLSLVQSLCPEGITAGDIIEAWNSCIGQIPRERLDMIKELRRRGYHTHLLSNTNDLHWEEVKRRYFSEAGYTCKDLFDHVFVSHEMHLAKPDLEIYREAVRRIGRPASECLFIDDTQANVEGARRAGLQAAWLDIRQPNALKTILEKYL